MGYWFCKKHGKAVHMPVCVHLKKGVESGSPLDFSLVMEEVSRSESSYISTLLCEECAQSIGLSNRATVFFDPQVRRFEKNEDVGGELDCKYKDVFEGVRGNITSVCCRCLEEVFAGFQEKIDGYKRSAVEVEKQLLE